MVDNKSKAGGQDRARINVNEDYELDYWSKKFGVTPDKLKQATNANSTRIYYSIEKFRNLSSAMAFVLPRLGPTVFAGSVVVINKGVQTHF